MVPGSLPGELELERARRDDVEAALREVDGELLADASRGAGDDDDGCAAVVGHWCSPVHDALSGAPSKLSTKANCSTDMRVSFFGKPFSG